MVNHLLLRSSRTNNFRSLFLFIVLACIIIQSKAQTKSQEPENKLLKKNSAYIELGGNALFYSINIDRLLYQTGNFRASLRIGAGFFDIGKQTQEVYLPIELCGWFGKHNNYFELGGGVVPSWGNRKFIVNPGVKNPTYSYFYYDRWYTLRFGYRYQRMNGGFMMRAGITPLIMVNEYSTLRDVAMHNLWPSLSLGWSF